MRKWIDWKTYESRTRKLLHIRLCEKRFNRLMSLHRTRQQRKNHTISDTIRMLLTMGMDQYESNPTYAERQAQAAEKYEKRGNLIDAEINPLTNLMQLLNDKDGKD